MDVSNQEYRDLEKLALASKLRSAMTLVNQFLCESMSMTDEETASARAEIEALKSSLHNRQIPPGETKAYILKILNEQINELTLESTKLETLQLSIEYDRQVIATKIKEITLMATYVNNT